jgi:photosystem II stability/assembly factor-like uncharacterized protein
MRPQRTPSLLATVTLIGGILMSAQAQEPLTVGKTPADQKRNAKLLSGYDYGKYVEGLTGYTGQDMQRIGFVTWQHAVRTRVGPRGNYKAGMTRLPSGELVLAACRDSGDPDPLKRFDIFVYRSRNYGLTWREIAKVPGGGKEPSLTALPQGSILMTAQRGYGLDQQPTFRSEDGGQTWQEAMVPANDYPRNLIVEPDGSLLMVRALKEDWYNRGGGSPNLRLDRSRDGGKTWECSEGVVDWDWPGFGEVSAIRLRDGRLLAALRRQVPGTTDNGKHWSKPRQMVNNAEVHVYLTELADGRILATYSNYHLPWGVFAVVSADGGRTFDLEHPIQLALSAGYSVGWPVTLQLPDKSLITCYASTAYYQEQPSVVCEVVRWRMP